MPTPKTSNHDGRAANAWFGQSLGLQLLQQFQGQAIPEITRVFGHSGLFLRPSAHCPEELPGNGLAQTLSLYRQGDGFSGAIECEDALLPIASESQALVYSLCVLETSPNPQALFAEMARCLKPEGTLLVLGLNIMSPTRIRWNAGNIKPMTKISLRQLCSKHGLEINKLNPVGPIWLRSNQSVLRDESKAGLMQTLYAGHMLVAKHRVATLTPVRKTSKAFSLNPGALPG